MSEYQEGLTAPPFHPSCRCCTAPYFADMEGLGERFTRDAETGERYKVPRDMTYEQWKKSFVTFDPENTLPTPTAGGTINTWDSWKKISGDHTIAADLAATNPNYVKGGNYRMNCGYCTTAYEMRRRGFDVEANPVNTLYVTDWKAMFDGFVPIQARSRKKSSLVGEISHIAQSWGDGARGTIFVQWENRRIGHFFSIEVINGSVMFVDPQNGNADAVDYFKLVRPSSVIFGRLDNLVPTDNVIKACKLR